MKNKIFSGAYIRKLFDNKKFTITFSLVLSVIICFFAMANRNPIRNHTFSNMNIGLSIEGTVLQEMGLGIVSDFSSQNFSVTVSGPNYIVSSLKAEDINLTASITNVNSAGKYSLDVVSSSNSKKTGYNIVSIEPSKIDVTFDYIDTKEFVVVPQLIGVSAKQGLIAETPIVSNVDESSITIKGPRSVINSINSVVATATVNKTLSSTQTYDADIILYDDENKVIYEYRTDGKIYNAAGNEVINNYLTLSKTSVKISQPISKKATLPVKVTFSNLPSAFSASDIAFTVDHTSVAVIGTPDVVEKMTEVTLSTIDFRSVSNTSNSFELSAVLPDGVKFMDNIEVFIVEINTTGYAVRTFNVSDIRFTDVKSGLTAKSNASVRNVKICGPKKTINSLSAKDLYAQASLEDKSKGEHTVNLTIKSKEHDDVWQIGEYTTTVTVK